MLVLLEHIFLPLRKKQPFKDAFENSPFKLTLWKFLTKPSEKL
jgi:hypothetical protein